MGEENSPRNPRTKTEWQEAADEASLFQLIDSARQYGLITGGPKVDLDRCDWLIAEAAKRGIRPIPLCHRDLARELRERGFLGEPAEKVISAEITTRKPHA